VFNLRVASYPHPTIIPIFVVLSVVQLHLVPVADYISSENAGAGAAAPSFIEGGGGGGGSMRTDIVETELMVEVGASSASSA
jgi:hypothetical protein